MNQNYPNTYTQISDETKLSGFDMASDGLTCSLLRTLASSKCAGKFLELGTGTGLSTAWILDGMDENSSLTSIDNDEKFIAIANKYLSNDSRLDLITIDGGRWIEENKGNQYDYIFADTWHGKYLLLNDVLAMLNKGINYIGLASHEIRNLSHRLAPAFFDDTTLEEAFKTLLKTFNVENSQH